ncbi:trihelix transcription factor ASIL2 [Salvia miltiorrhiza]|uniref:trihelix transcription factor ASIL2 n=1 Tax=Salvia miltiorrhiza TaxID=226208 RepID=UPI0025ACCA32|nr:trihelix transcription factor ASIL2 [Salvia miltiorrhiza]
MTSSASSPSPSASPPPRPLLLPTSRQSHSASPSPSPKHHLPPPESKSSPPKRSPPLPWTHQETLALIQAYQEKWHSLKKGQLKAFQWEEVSITVAARCGFDEPSKTATQCRHKIEKLRKRYRSELQKPYLNSWQYFELMDQMERGPMPLDARPITIAKSFPNNTSSNSNNNNNVSNFSHGYSSLYPSSTEFYNNDGGGGGGGDSGVSDDSDEKWNTGHVPAAATRNKSKSINNIVRGDVRGGVRGAKGVAVERGFGGGGGSGGRGGRVVRNLVKGRPMDYSDGGFSDDDGDDSDEDAAEEEQVMAEEGGSGRGGVELAAEIRGFTERFMGMENKKIEMMQETERYRMDMEKKKMEMIAEAQRKMVDTIRRAFGAHKRAKMDQES